MTAQRDLVGSSPVSMGHSVAVTARRGLDFSDTTSNAGVDPVQVDSRSS